MRSEQHLEARFAMRLRRECMCVTVHTHTHTAKASIYERRGKSNKESETFQRGAEESLVFSTELGEREKMNEEGVDSFFEKSGNKT